MNILYIEHYAGSPEMGMEFRPYYLSREWVKMGHHVTIIAADYSHLRRKNPNIDYDFQVTDLDGIEYVWIKTDTYEGNGAKRALTMGQFIYKLLSYSKMIAERWKPDVVIASSTYPLDTYPAQKIAKLSGAKYIHEIHDMWPAVLTEVNGMKKSNPFVISMQIAENSFCKHADGIVSLPPCSKEYLMKHGMKPEKYISVVNGVNLEDWQNADELNEETRSILVGLKTNNKFIICFFGSLTNYYALPELIRAVQCSKIEEVVVVFVGEGGYKPYLQEIASQKNENRFIFLNRIPKKQVPSMLKYVDALYVGGVKDSVFKYGICMNKLFDSMMAGKPIIYAVDAPNNYIEQFKCGISVEAGSVDALEAGIEKMYSLSEEERSELGNNGHYAVLDNFTYPRLAEKFASIFK